MSFNDLLTVLLTFFILLVSVSEINVNKVQDLSFSAADVFRSKIYENQKDQLIRAIGAVDGIRVHPVAGGISVVLSESLLYRSGSADIIQKGMLKQLGERLKKVAGSIRIEGHTDSIPISNGPFSSNWELSTQRAVNVVKFIINETGMDPQILSVAGYADSRPVASNDSHEGRALNRRVNMIILLK